MKISKEKLTNMIKESISRILLKEYGGEQLVLPFDGNTRAYNYMQYIDFVKSITKPGEITSNVHSIEDYYEKIKFDDYALFDIGLNCSFYHGYGRDEFDEDEYADVIGELEDKYGNSIYGENNNAWSQNYCIGEELSDEGFNLLAVKLIEQGKMNLKWILPELFRYCVDGMLYINRKLSIPNAFDRNGEYGTSEKDLYGYLTNTYNDLGCYWAYGTDTGCVYRGDYRPGGSSTVSLIAMTPIENVNIAEVCSLFNVGESEIGFHDDSKIMLVGLTVDGKKINIGHRVYK